MPRAAKPEWKRRKQPILDHLWVASINQAGGQHDDNGCYQELFYTGIESRQRAAEIKRALYRARKYVAGGISGYAYVEKDGDGYKVRFCAINKTHSYKYMLEKYGSDRTKYPYSPWSKDPNYDPNEFVEE
jgi:hypothetical protein